jgi:nicotinate phosphoribosyltransferase
VLAFADEQRAFETFLRDVPDSAVLLVDTFDTRDGVRHAIAASVATGVPLKGVRLDSGDLLELSRAARAMLDAAGMPHAHIVASGDLDEHRIAALVRAGAPIDVWGVGTALGTSEDAPALGGVYKLVADRANGGWRPVAKRSPAKATLPAPKQVFRHSAAGRMSFDVLALAGEPAAGRPLLAPAMRGGRVVLDEPLAALRARAAAELAALPAQRSYPVRISRDRRAAPRRCPRARCGARSIRRRWRSRRPRRSNRWTGCRASRARPRRWRSRWS